ncbi:MAG: hypothetical protein ACRDVM_06040, partial [Acidimicrobiia bacterium]
MERPDQPQRPGFSLLVTVLSVVVGGWVVIGSVQVPAASPPATIPVEPLEAAAPDRFAPWPPMVVTWEVTGHVEREPNRSVFNTSIGYNPCGMVTGPTCYLRFAWEDYVHWSLTTSSDRRFDATDPIELTIGEIHYGVVDGVVQGVKEAGRIPPLDICHDLLRARRAGEGVEVSRTEPGDLPHPVWALLELSGPGRSAACYGPSGFPVGLDELGHTWRWVEMELRRPSDAEIGRPLVEARMGPSSGCLPIAARDWLVGLASGIPGAAAGEAGMTVWLDHPSADGPVRLWATSGDSQPDLRRREVAPGVIVEEATEPLAVSLPAGPVRLWAAYPEDVGHAPVATEEAARELGLVLLDLV